MTETSAAPSATDSRQQLLELIKAHAIVHGKVTLSSGKEADFYVDLRRITLDGQAAPLVGEVMLDLTADLDYDAVGGLTLGADPVATVDAARRGRGRGALRRVRGPQGGQGARPAAADRGPVGGRAGGCVVVEDTSTTGGSPLAAVEAVREAGAEVVAVAVIADRASGAAREDRGGGLPLRRGVQRRGARPGLSTRRGAGRGARVAKTAYRRELRSCHRPHRRPRRLVVLLDCGRRRVYNGLIKLRNVVQEAWAQIDVELKRRHDLIPNLVETVKGYAVPRARHARGRSRRRARRRCPAARARPRAGRRARTC